MKVGAGRIVVVPDMVTVTGAVGCASSSTSGRQATTITSTASARPAAPTGKQDDRAATGVVLDITIGGGAVTPKNAEVQAKVGQPLVMRVDSDVADTLHVHSVPEYTFDVEPR